jgi:soluble lytic murein transglycosylase-like protein
MEALLLKLQNDVAARKRAPRDKVPLTKVGCAVMVIFMLAFELGARSADASADAGLWMTPGSRLADLTARVEAQAGEIEFQRAHIERLEKAYDFSARYDIPADLAISIEEIALAEGIDPQLAFDPVRVESEFNPRAVSSVGALGLTQLMPETARLLSPGITREQIFETETNLRLGFRFLGSLLSYYDGDVRLALLAYNRGPTIVDRLLAAGVDPGNGYASAVLGTGTR